MSKSDDEEGIKFWIQCYKEKIEAEGECEQGGRVQALWKFLPKNSDDLKLLGNGREEPNTIPYLSPSVGKFDFI